MLCTITRGGRGLKSQRPQAMERDGQRDDERDRTAPAVHRRDHGGRLARPGRRPHIHDAVSDLDDQQNASTMVLSQVLNCSMPEKPSVKIGRPAGVCSLP